MKTAFSFWFFLLNLLVTSTNQSEIDKDVRHLKPNIMMTFDQPGKLEILCSQKEEKTFYNIWKSKQLEFRKVPNDYLLFVGDNVTNVKDQYKIQESSWYPQFFPWRKTSLSLPVFQDICVGVSSSETFVIEMIVRHINYWNVVMLVAGVCAFYSAPILSRNVMFYYASGISFGVMASILIIIYILSRFIPKRSGTYSFFLLGSSMTLYFAQLALEHVQHIVKVYWIYLIAYTAISSLVSFIVCYRMGPVTNIRTLNLIQWFIQGIGLALIFFSSEYREVSISTIALIILIYLFPSSWTAKVRTLIRRRWFPPKIKLLTEEEYIFQGNVETKKALEELRAYCASPDCKSWKMVSRLQSPIRFASFVEGESHLTDDEIMRYDAEQHSFGEEDISEDEELVEQTNMLAINH